ncbi:MAG: thymidine kinase [Planctomycetota bacterium]|jgi:thymidine kinase
MMHQHPPGSGWIEVICGPMFSGKTEELIRRITRAYYAKQPVQIFKPAVDVRYDETKVVSHNGRAIDSIVIARGSEIFDHLNDDTRIVAIDEAQFLEDDTVRVARELAAEGRRVIVAGLDQDYQGKPFDTMMQFLVEAEYITKNLAICLSCGAPAHRNQRLIEASGRLILGGTSEYEARCRACFEPVKAEEGPLFEDL